MEDTHGTIEKRSATLINIYIYIVTELKNKLSRTSVLASYAIYLLL